MDPSAPPFAGNRAAQDDEIEALKSIYGEEDFVLHGDYSCELLVRPMEDGGFVAPLRLYIYFPESYPEASEPVLEIEAPWLNPQLREKIIHELHRIFEENIGNAIIFAWVEWIKEQLWLWEEARNQAIHEKGYDFAKLESTGDPYIDGHEEKPFLVDKVSSELSNVDLKGKDAATRNTDYKGTDELDAHALEELDTILGIVHGTPFTEKRSTFQAHVASVASVDDVKNVVEALLRNRKIAGATHNIMAYRISIPEKSTVLQDYDDDGETAAGGRLLHLLQIVDAINVVVVVSRWFGGILLGPDRFKHINNAARSLLNSCGYIKGSGQSASHSDKHKMPSKGPANKGRRC